MPSKTDPDTSHDATETHPDPSGVSVRGSRHPSLRSVPLPSASTSRRRFAAPSTRVDDVYFDPRSVDTGDGPREVLRAKAVVHITSDLSRHYLR